MPEIEYRIGELRIDPARLRHTDIDPYKSSHKFVVATEGNVASIYVGIGKRHALVADSFGLLPQIDGKQIIGGGSCYTDADANLVLNDFSADFKAIPKEAAERFAGLIRPEIEKQDVQISGIKADPLRMLNKFWSDLGF